MRNRVKVFVADRRQHPQPHTTVFAKPRWNDVLASVHGDKVSARDKRMQKPPSWNGAALKALAMAVLLFVLTQVGILGNDASIQQGIFLSALALIIYTPLAYVTDKWVYARMLRQKAAKKA